jgi:hypothetical protein
MKAIKSPLEGGLISSFAVLSPPNPYRAALKTLHAYSARVFNLLKDLLPRFCRFCFKSGDSYGLDLLDSWRSYQTLDAPTDQLIRVSGLRCG